MQEIFSEITQPGMELAHKSHAYASELRLKKEERLTAWRHKIRHQRSKTSVRKKNWKWNCVCTEYSADTLIWEISRVANWNCSNHSSQRPFTFCTWSEFLQTNGWIKNSNLAIIWTSQKSNIKHEGFAILLQWWSGWKTQDCYLYLLMHSLLHPYSKRRKTASEELLPNWILQVVVKLE